MQDLRSKDYKDEAREMLTGNWGTLVLIVLAGGIITELVSMLVEAVFKNEDTASSIESLLSILVLFAFSYASFYASLFVIRGGKAKFEMLTVIFQKRYFLPVMGLNFLYQLAGVASILIITLPVISMAGLSVVAGMSASGVSYARGLVGFLRSASYGAAFFLILGLIFLLIVVGWILSGYFQMAIWLKMDFPQMRAGQALSYAWRLIKNRLGRFILLNLSFFGWYVIGIILFIIPVLWVVVYHRTSIASFYDHALRDAGDPVY